MVRPGIWERMHEHFIEEPDIEYLIIDSTDVPSSSVRCGRA